MALKQENPALFSAINMLKANTFVYGRGQGREAYETLIAFREDANRILSYDNCEMRINTELETAKIHFLGFDETGTTDNLLRAKFSANDMKVYMACLTIYSERYASQGTYIDILFEDVLNCLASLNLSVGIGRRRGESSKGDIKTSILNLERYGMLDYRMREDSMLLKPGITMGMDVDEFNKAYEEIFATWKGNEEEEDSSESGD